MGSQESAKITLRPGELLFNKGDPGGDLYFIEQGSLEIFVYQDGRPVIYTEMGAGEIVGVLTCLTGEPRMASARAKTELVCKRVPYRNIEQALNRLPRWFRVVIKEYANRLEEMNRRYGELDLQRQDLEENQISHRYTAGQLTAALVELAPLYRQPVEGQSEAVDWEKVLAAAGRVLNQPWPVVQTLAKALRDSGLLRPGTEPRSRRELLSGEDLQRLVFFNNLLANRRSSRVRSLLKLDFKKRELKLLRAIVALARQQGTALQGEAGLEMGRLWEAINTAPGMDFAEADLSRALEAGLLSRQGVGEAAVLRLVPGRLLEYAVSLEAWRRLGVLDRTSGHSLGRSEDGRRQPRESWYRE